ncbi:hypothetical protein, partial [Thiolapillus sp.]
RSEAYFVFPLAQGTPGKQCGLAATGVYQPSLRSPWLAAVAQMGHQTTVANSAHDYTSASSIPPTPCRVIAHPAQQVAARPASLSGADPAAEPAVV